MSHDHNHAPSQIRHERPLWWALGLTVALWLSILIGSLLLMPSLAPVWAQHLWTALSA